MANFFSSIGDVLKQTLWDQPIDIAKNVAKGDFKEAFGDFKSTFGDNNRELSDVFNSVGIRGKIGDNPQEAIGATLGTILGGWAAAPAMGAGAAGTAAGATGAGAAGAGSAIGAGTGAAGMSAAGAAGAGAGSAATGIGAGMAYVPTASTVLGGSGATMTGSGITAAGSGLAGTGASAGTATGLGLGTEIGAGASAFAPEAGSALAYAPTQSAALGGTGSGAPSSLSMFDKINNGVQMLNKLQGQQQKDQGIQPMQMAAPKQTGPVKAFGGNNNASGRARQNTINMIANNPFMQNKFMGGQ